MATKKRGSSWASPQAAEMLLLLVVVMVMEASAASHRSNEAPKTEIIMDGISMDILPDEIAPEPLTRTNKLDPTTTSGEHQAEERNSARHRRDKATPKKTLPLPHINIFHEMQRFNHMESSEAEAAVRDLVGRQMLSAMDPEVDPCQNFYRYACGRWSHGKHFPEDVQEQSPFQQVRLDLQEALRDMLEKEEKEEENENKEPFQSNRAFQITSSFYRSCMDQEMIEEKGSEPIISILEELGGWPVLDKAWNAKDFQWEELAAQVRKLDVQVLLGEKVGPDLGTSGTYIVQLDQPPSLGLPTPSHFLKPAYQKARDAYLHLMVQTAIMLGADPSRAREQMDEAFQFEIQVAKIMVPRGARRNLTSHYLRTTLRELEDSIPTLNVSGYLSQLVLEPSLLTPDMGVSTFAAPYLHSLAELTGRSEPRTMANAICWRLVQSLLPYLSQRFSRIQDRLSQVLGGSSAAARPTDRWRFCLHHANSLLPSLLGAIFVPKFLHTEVKFQAEGVAEEVRKAFLRAVDRADWLTNSTRKMAKAKLRKMALKVGYADDILDERYQRVMFSSIEVQEDELMQNVLSIQQARVRRKHARLGHIIQVDHWGAPPTILNAVYSHDHNRMVIPAAMLEPPFYHHQLPLAVNYGGLGSIVGHEMSHSLEERGRLFDAVGQLNDWWSPLDTDVFLNRSQCIQEKYSKYPGVGADELARIRASAGEDLADNGGIRHAFRAYRHWLAKATEEEKVDEVLPDLPLLRPKQLFFLSYAQLWCSAHPHTQNKDKDINTGLWDSQAMHTPPNFRVLGAMSNFDEFAKAFRCLEGSPMNPTDRCFVW